MNPPFSKCIVLILSMFMSMHMHAQTYSISGQVRDSLYKAIENATLIINPGNKLVSTNKSGEYEFSNTKPGTYSISCYAYGKSIKTI